MRDVALVLLLKRLPTTGTSPSPGTLSTLEDVLSRVMPPISRLSPSAISACVLMVERSTTGIWSTWREVRLPSSTLTSSLMRVASRSRNTCGVTRSEVPALTLNRSTCSRPATRT